MGASSQPSLSAATHRLARDGLYHSPRRTRISPKTTHGGLGTALLRALAPRLALAAAGLAVALGGAEIALRLSHPTLPSLEALAHSEPREVGDFMRWSDPQQREAGCQPAKDTHRLHYRPRYAKYEPSPAAATRSALRLWVAGDSVVAGWGVGPEQGWPHALARGLANRRSAAVNLTLVGGGGLGYCDVLLDLHRILERSRPDVVLVQLFADDLEQRALLQLKEGVVARPDAVPGAFAWMARRSWLANRVWFAWVTRLGGAQPVRGLDARAQRQFQLALRLIAERLAGIDARLLFVLVPPAGVERCGQQGAAWSDCDWLTHDMNWMATELERSKQPWVDLRQLWARSDPQTLREEEEAWTARGRLPVHPGVLGHKALAEAVLPQLAALLEPPATPPADPGAR